MARDLNLGTEFRLEINIDAFNTRLAYILHNAKYVYFCLFIQFIQFRYKERKIIQHRNSLKELYENHKNIVLEKTGKNSKSNNKSKRIPFNKTVC